jgi:hypothetical protein
LKQALAIAIMSTILFPGLASAQRKTRKKTPQRRPQATETASQINPTVRRDAAQRVAGQLKTLTQFLYLYSGVIKQLAAADEAMKTGQPSNDLVAAAERNKRTLRESIHNVQLGLERIENDFGNNPSLRAYYHTVLGVSSIGAQAVQQADAGQFDQAGRSLLRVSERLTDALATMSDATGLQ